MQRKRDPLAYEQAVKKWVIPECLHVPVAAVDEKAINQHIGEVIKVISPGKALLVEIGKPLPKDLRLPIWKHPRSEVFFHRLQVWVSPTYTRYRTAYCKAIGGSSISGQVLAHMYNRRMAILRGYGFIRLVPVSRKANSSSSFCEQWGVALAKKGKEADSHKLSQRIQYADLCDLLVMLDLNLGGGVMEMFRIGQDLIEVPGIRKAQADCH